MTNRINIRSFRKKEIVTETVIQIFLSKVNMNIEIKFNKISYLSFGLLLARVLQRSKDQITIWLKRRSVGSHNVAEASRPNRAVPALYLPEEVACV